MEQLKNKNLISLSVIFTLLSIVFSCQAQEHEFKSIDDAQKNSILVKRLIIRNDNKYSSFPLSIYALKNIEVLSFTGTDCDISNQSCVNIETLPDGIEDLTKLKEIYLVMNHLKTLPEGINDLQDLKVLDLSNNPEIVIDNLSSSSLEVLNLNECFLNEIPNNIFKLKNLKVLGLEGNNISEEDIQAIKSSLPNLEIYY
jgi:Leucine-rich repeat (LRR) protein